MVPPSIGLIALPLLRLPFGRRALLILVNTAAGDDRHRRPVHLRSVLVGAQFHRLHHLFGVAVLNGGRWYLMVSILRIEMMGDRDIGKAVFRRNGVTAAAGVDDRHRRPRWA